MNKIITNLIEGKWYTLTSASGWSSLVCQDHYTGMELYIFPAGKSVNILAPGEKMDIITDAGDIVFAKQNCFPSEGGVDPAPPIDMDALSPEKNPGMWDPYLQRSLVNSGGHLTPGLGYGTGLACVRIAGAWDSGSILNEPADTAGASHIQPLAFTEIEDLFFKVRVDVPFQAKGFAFWPWGSDGGWGWGWRATDLGDGTVRWRLEYGDWYSGIFYDIKPPVILPRNERPPAVIAWFTQGTGSVYFMVGGEVFYALANPMPNSPPVVFGSPTDPGEVWGSALPIALAHHCNNGVIPFIKYESTAILL